MISLEGATDISNYSSSPAAAVEIGRKKIGKRELLSCCTASKSTRNFSNYCGAFHTFDSDLIDISDQK